MNHVERFARLLLQEQVTGLLPPQLWAGCEWDKLSDETRAGWIRRASAMLFVECNPCIELGSD